MLLLPGGLMRAGVRRRDFAWAPLYGGVELILAESAVGVDETTMPERVSAALAGALAHLGGEPVTADVAGELCVADRQFLMQRLAARLGLGRRWETDVCRACGETFDVPVSFDELPVKEGGAGYPFATVDTSHGPVRLRVPSGADQAAVAAIDDARAAVRSVVARCQLDGTVAAHALSDDDLRRIDESLDDVSPAVTTEVEAACPGCGAAQAVAVDPYAVLGAATGELFDDICALASTFHWNEREILELPRHRRKLYLRLLDRARGMAT